MLNIPLIDLELFDDKQLAEEGDIESLLYIASHLSKGKGVKQDIGQARKIFENIIKDKDKLQDRRYYWFALVGRIGIYDLKDKKEREIATKLVTELAQDMTSYPIEEWNLNTLRHAIKFLEKIENHKLQMNQL